MQDFFWSIHNDRLSVTVGINHRIGLLKAQRIKPTLIILGGWATKAYMKEWRLAKVPEETIYYAGVPIRFKDPKVIGIAIEGEPMPPKQQKKRKPQKHPE